MDEFPAIGTGNFLSLTGNRVAPNSELECLFIGVKRTSPQPKHKSANDPKQTVTGLAQTQTNDSQRNPALLHASIGLRMLAGELNQRATQVISIITSLRRR